MRTRLVRPSAARRTDVRVLPSAPRARLVAAARFLVHRRPGVALSLLFRRAALLVAFGDMLGLALLLVGVLVIVSAWHGLSPSSVGSIPGQGQFPPFAEAGYFLHAPPSWPARNPPPSTSTR